MAIRRRALARETYAGAGASRLAKRLRAHCDEPFTFLDYPAVPFGDTVAEQMRRPAAVLRTNSQSSRREKGAAAQAVLMSVFRPRKLRGHDPLGVLPGALRSYLASGTLPTLRGAIVAAG